MRHPAIALMFVLALEAGFEGVFQLPDLGAITTAAYRERGQVDATQGYG
jgi:hypothetical protein